MNKSIRVLFLAALVLISASVITTCLLLKNAPPRLTFLDDQVFDWGFINEGSSITHDFQFKNTGKKPLHIEKLVTGCGCTEAKASKEFFAPGEIGTITVGYRARPLKDKEIILVGIITNDEKQPLQKLMISGFVKNTVFWYPESLSFFINDKSKEYEKEIQFLTDQTGELQTKKNSSSISNILPVCNHNEKGVLCKVHVDDIGTLKLGGSTENIELTFSVNEIERKVVLPVYLMVR